jgi:hypothetical protein
MRWMELVASVDGIRNEIGKSEERRPFVRRRYTYEENIRMGLNRMNMEMWTGFIWLRIGSSVGLL